MSESPNQVIISEDSPSKVIVDETAPNLVVVRTAAVPGGSTRRHTHTQASPSTSWTVTHVLGGNPQVTIVDTSNTAVIGDVTYDSGEQITISFSAAFAGTAYLT
jgi:quercetin dioxygenase-like cupin family protein